MRKYVIGAFFGFMLATTVTAHAEVVNMIGKVVDGAFPVKVNGTTLKNQAVVIEGTSYLPVREFGESLGMEVLFDADMGIELKSAIKPEITSTKPVDAVKKALKDAVSYDYKSTSLRLREDKLKFFEVNGEQYIAIAPLVGYVNVENDKTTFTFPGKEKIYVPLNEFVGDTSGSYVKVATLGIAATIDGATLFIEN